MSTNVRSTPGRPAMLRRSRLILTLALVALVTLAAAVAIPSVRDAALRGVGWALVVHDSLAHADVIVVANDADGSGVLEAADLVHEGIAPRVALFVRPQTDVAREFAKRGIPYGDSTAASAKELTELGIASVERIPGPVAGTHDEGNVLVPWCRDKRYHTIVFVSTSDHSRRTRRVLRREMRGTQTHLIVWYSHYSSFDPNTWWRTRNEVRIAIVEYEKLLLDLLRHPLG